VARFLRIVTWDDTSFVLRCWGDEDRATQGRRRGALARALKATTDVVVDLAGLEFADASLMVDFAMLSRRLRRRGGGLWLRGAQPQVSRLIEVVGLHRLDGVRLDGGSALAA
jgi:anti-anti-sigma factor